MLYATLFNSTNGRSLLPWRCATTNSITGNLELGGDPSGGDNVEPDRIHILRCLAAKGLMGPAGEVDAGHLARQFKDGGIAIPWTFQS